jgi:hypothetical protein
MGVQIFSGFRHCLHNYLCLISELPPSTFSCLAYSSGPEDADGIFLRNFG